MESNFVDVANDDTIKSNCHQTTGGGSLVDCYYYKMKTAPTVRKRTCVYDKNCSTIFL